MSFVGGTQQGIVGSSCIISPTTGGRAFTQVFTVMGPAGAPMRPPYGPFTGKNSRPFTQTFTVMGPAGSPMRPPYGAFTGKSGPTKNVVLTVMGPAGAPMKQPYLRRDHNYLTGAGAWLDDGNGNLLIAQ